MPETYPTRKWRIEADVAGRAKSLTNLEGGAMPVIWTGESLQVELGIFRGRTPISLSDIAKVIFEVKNAQTGETALVYKEVTLLTDTITASAWRAGNAQHCTVEVSAAEAALDLAGARSARYWCVIHGLSDSGEQVVYAAGEVEWREGNRGALTPPANPLGTGIRALNGGTEEVIEYPAEDADTKFLRGDKTFAVPAGGGGGSADWGDIGGTLADQTDLQSALNAKAAASALSSHIADTENPHEVTKAQVGLANAENTADADKPVSTAQQTALDLKANAADLGALAPLDTVGTDEIDDDAVTSAKVADGVIAALAKIASAIRLGSGTKLATVKAGAGTPGSLMAFSLDGSAEDYNLGGELANYATGSELSAHAGDTGNPHEVTKTQVGLGNADNTADADKPVSTAAQAALDAKADLVGGKVPTSQIPEVAITEYLGEAADQTAMLALDGQYGDWCVRTDDGKVYVITGPDPSDAGDWTALNYPASPVTSVAGKTGAVTLAKGDVGLGNVDNTADADKPVSTAQQAALDDKADDSALSSHAGNTGNPHSVTKAQVGLGNADNTADADKPVSTAQQAALDNKAKIFTLNAQSGTTYTLQASDSGKVVRCTNAAGCAITVPASLGLTEPVTLLGTQGAVSLTASSTTLNKETGYNLESRAAFAAIQILPTGTADTYDVIGGLAAA